MTESTMATIHRLISERPTQRLEDDFDRIFGVDHQPECEAQAAIEGADGTRKDQPSKSRRMS